MLKKLPRLTSTTDVLPCFIGFEQLLDNGMLKSNGWRLFRGTLKDSGQQIIGTLLLHNSM